MTATAQAGNRVRSPLVSNRVPSRGGRLLFVSDPRVFGSDSYRGALQWTQNDDSSDTEWSSARFLVVDEATRRLQVVRQFPTNSPCASWTCTFAARGFSPPCTRFWSDCPLPGGTAEIIKGPPKGGVLGFHKERMRLELFPMKRHGENPPENATVDWVI